MTIYRVLLNFTERLISKLFNLYSYHSLACMIKLVVINVGGSRRVRKNTLAYADPFTYNHCSHIKLLINLQNCFLKPFSETKIFIKINNLFSVYFFNELNYVLTTKGTLRFYLLRVSINTNTFGI